MIELSLFGVIYSLFIVFILGASIGSFLNVCIYRIPRDESIVRPRSHCPNCNKMIAWYDNIPVLSYCMLRAKCRHCGKAISSRYVMVELLVALLFILVWLLYGLLHASTGNYWLILDRRIPIYWLAMSGLVVATFVDLEHYIIPDRISLGGIVAGLALSVLVPALHNTASRWFSFNASIGGAICGAGVLWLVAVIGKAVLKKDAMGMGDVKLLGAIGAFLGWQAVFFTIILSSFIGTIAGVSLILFGSKKWQSRIPYGPYIAVAAMLWILWGSDWWAAYIQWAVSQGA